MKEVRRKIGNKLIKLGFSVHPDDIDSITKTTNNNVQGDNGVLEAFKPFSKAVAATIAGAVVAYMTKNNIIIADGLEDSIEILLSAVILGAAVFLAPRNKEVK